MHKKFLNVFGGGFGNEKLPLLDHAFTGDPLTAWYARNGLLYSTLSFAFSTTTFNCFSAASMAIPEDEELFNELSDSNRRLNVDVTMGPCALIR